MFRIRRSNKEGREAEPNHKKPRRWRWPRLPRRIVVDLNNPWHRRILILSGVVGVLVLSGVLFAGYEVYEFTESAEFCGELCHSMSPEYERYRHSPHANVECATCHVGPGAKAFIKSKIEGTRQLLAVLTNSYERPIKSPVHNLRPARVICEQCHNPQNFQDNIVKTITHYANDKDNTPVTTLFVLKMGGWQEFGGFRRGIHWHISAKVYYIPVDERRQVIAWIGVEQPDGTLKEYWNRDMLNVDRETFVKTAMEEGRARLMDCIDCHNRVAHLIPPPEVVVDEAIQSGALSRSLPYIRAKAVALLKSEYASEEEAYAAIEGLADFYREQYPEVYQRSQNEIQRAIQELKALYSVTNFPDMRMDWATNPNNERHTPFMGCFRCHDGKHVALDPQGNEIEAISVKCNLCHTVPIVGRGTETLEVPVVSGTAPASHSDFRWTIEHRTTTQEQIDQECLQCHGRTFCNNEACHNLSHPPNMVYTHAQEYTLRGDEVCYTCHQNYVLCSRCHPGGIVGNSWMGNWSEAWPQGNFEGSSKPKE